VWALAGLLSLVGALCYAELASTYPRLGGDYAFLTRAYGPGVGFLFGWAQLAVILTGSIGMTAYLFADYAVSLWDAGPEWATGLAVLAVVGLTLLNALGVACGKRVQNLLTAAKVLGLAGILVTAFKASAPVPTASAAPAVELSLAYALVLALLAYGGWNDAVYLSTELRDVRRNIPKALILGIAAVTVIHLGVNLAYLYGLGFEGVRASKAIAADLFKSAFGPAGAQAGALLVMVLALGMLNAQVMAGPRLYAALGADHPVFARLGRWHPRRGVPLTALLVQMVVCVGLILVVGSGVGQALLDSALTRVGVPPVPWDGHGGFELLLRSTAPVFWAFFGLTALSLFVLRRKDRGIARPFAVPLYPVLPLIFCATCGFMFVSSLHYAGRLGLLGAGLLATGVPLYWLSQRRALFKVADSLRESGSAETFPSSVRAGP
jgi:amino acid transporter